MTIENALPCPFCGSRDLHVSEIGEYWIACLSCMAEAGKSNTFEGAISIWNKRRVDEDFSAKLAEAVAEGHFELTAARHCGCHFADADDDLGAKVHARLIGKEAVRLAWLRLGYDEGDDTAGDRKVPESNRKIVDLKIVDLTSSQHVVTALCDDGTVWQILRQHSHLKGRDPDGDVGPASEWVRLPDIPKVN